MAGEDQSLRQWIVQNKLKAIFGFWAGGLGLSLAYQWTRPIPTQLKIIHSRVTAQALTLAGLGIAATMQYLEEKPSAAEARAAGGAPANPAPKATGLH